MSSRFNDFCSDWNGNRKGFYFAADSNSAFRLKSSMHLGLLKAKTPRAKPWKRSVSFRQSPIPIWQLTPPLRLIFPQLFVSIYLILLSHSSLARQSNVVPFPARTKTCTSLNIICFAFCCRAWGSFPCKKPHPIFSPRIQNPAVFHPPFRACAWKS